MVSALSVFAAPSLVAAEDTPPDQAALPGPDQEAAERAADEIQAARDSANRAAEAFFALQSELDILSDKAAELVAEATELQQQVDALRAQVEQIAVNRFVASGSNGIPILTGYRAPSEQLQADALASVATQSSADTMDDYESARRQLDDAQQAVADNQAELDRKQKEYEELRAEAEQQVVDLKLVEEQRLEDERV